MMKRKLPISPARTSLNRIDMLTANRWTKLARSVERGLGDARAAMGDPRFQTETRAVLTDLTGASRRVREIGLTNAIGDKVVAKELSRASRHASNALGAARDHRRRRNMWWRALAVTGGVALTVGSAYGAWKMQTRSGSGH